MAATPHRQPGQLYRKSQEFRNALARGDRAAAHTMVSQYQAAYNRISQDITRTQGAIAALRDAGVPRDQWMWRLTQERRLLQLRESVLANLGKYGEAANAIVLGATTEAAASAVGQASELIHESLPNGLAVSPSKLPDMPMEWVAGEARLNDWAMQQLGAFQPTEYFMQQMGYHAAEAIHSAVQEGITIGENPRLIARRMRDSLGGSLSRSLTIARTETLRVYREASRQVYQAAPPGLLTGWKWIAACDLTTCPACWANHGRTFPLSMPMPAHPNCRCTMAPATASWEDLGFGTTPQDVQVPLGKDLFRKLPEEHKARILGPSRYKAYKGGGATLQDMAGLRVHPYFGESVQVNSLRRMNAAAKERRATARANRQKPDKAAARQAADARRPYTPEELVESHGQAPWHKGSGYQNNQTLERQYERLGYHDAPELMDSDAFDDLLALHPDMLRMGRGVMQQGDDALAFVDDFINGERHYGGRGILGDGTYTKVFTHQGLPKVDTPGWIEARSYAASQGATMDMALKPTAKVLRINEWAKGPHVDAWRAYVRKVDDAVARYKARTGIDLPPQLVREMQDYTAWAISEGYDAVYITNMDYLVVLNRSQVVVRDKVWNAALREWVVVTRKGAASAKAQVRVDYLGREVKPAAERIEVMFTRGLGSRGPGAKVAKEQLDDITANFRLPEWEILGQGNGAVLPGKLPIAGGRLSGETQGMLQLWGKGSDGTVDTFAIKLATTGSKTDAATLFHEFGHALDYGLMRATKAGVTRTDSLVSAFDNPTGPARKLWDVVESTQAYKRLMAMKAGVNFDNPVTGRVGMVFRDQEVVDYLQSPEEVFARAFAQYMARKSGRADAIRDASVQTSQNLRGIATWDDADFEPLYRAFDEFFRELGWLA